MKVKRPRAARYSFVASVHLRIPNQATKLKGLLGILVATLYRGNSTPIGTRGRVQIIHDGDVFEAQGRVMNARPITGVGITFLQIEERYQLILDKWLTNLRNNSQHP